MDSFWFRINRRHEFFDDLPTGLEGFVEDRASFALQIVCIRRKSWRRLIEDAAVQPSFTDLCERNLELLKRFKVLVFEMTLTDGEIGE